jgi:tetratricopeptide (TPR) repeat protein
LSPPKPAAGSRQTAIHFFHQGFQAQEEGRTNEALRAYRVAVDLDPAFFEAHYNLGLLAAQTGDLKAALQSCETALALQPDSAKARLHFGLTLMQANYPQDAAKELETVVQASADEARAHLALGNLFAQKLGQPSRAREHYLKVLEVQPRHPQAATIRYWLAANP